MSEFQEIKHLYSYGIQTCPTGMHFHQDLCVFVDSGFKAPFTGIRDGIFSVRSLFPRAKAALLLQGPRV